MKKLILVLILALAVPLAPIGCQTPPSERVVAVQTLKALGEAAEAAVTLSAQLYRNGTINAVQARAVIDFYDQKYQPAYRLAVAAANANLDSVANPEVSSLCNRLLGMVAQYQHKSP